MFDFSFSELLICFVIALVVLGPERLPGLVRTVGRWTGKARVYMRNLTAELERETQVSELKKQLEDAQRVLREQSQSFHAEATKLTDKFKSVQSLEPPVAKPLKPKPPEPPAASPGSGNG